MRADSEDTVKGQHRIPEAQQIAEVRDGNEPLPGHMGDGQAVVAAFVNVWVGGTQAPGVSMYRKVLPRGGRKQSPEHLQWLGCTIGS
jgi:hypothetical protein